MNEVRRRRECLSCQRRFTTFEAIELALQVCKRDGHYENFQPQKLLNGILSACSHTRISYDQAKALTSKVKLELMDLQEKKISTTLVGEKVMEHLRQLDTVAYIRFACVYRRFKDIEEVMDAISATDETSDKKVLCESLE